DRGADEEPGEHRMLAQRAQVDEAATPRQFDGLGRVGVLGRAHRRSSLRGLRRSGWRRSRWRRSGCRTGKRPAEGGWAGRLRSCDAPGSPAAATTTAPPRDALMVRIVAGRPPHATWEIGASLAG